jgi:hypothetical protein
MVVLVVDLEVCPNGPLQEMWQAYAHAKGHGKWKRPMMRSGLLTNLSSLTA